MDWIDWGDAATWGGVLVSVAAVAIAVWSRVDASRASGKAEEARDRSTRALEIAAAAQERLAALAEEQAARYVPPWMIEQVGNSRYLLNNKGDQVEYDVSIEGGFVMDSPVTQDRLGPREAVEFYAPRSMGDIDPTVTVHWYRHPRQGGDRQEWRHPLP